MKGIIYKWLSFLSYFQGLLVLFCILPLSRCKLYFSLRTVRLVRPLSLVPKTASMEKWSDTWPPSSRWEPAGLRTVPGPPPLPASLSYSLHTSLGCLNRDTAHVAPRLGAKVLRIRCVATGLPGFCLSLWVKTKIRSGAPRATEPRLQRGQSLGACSVGPEALGGGCPRPPRPPGSRKAAAAAPPRPARPPRRARAPTRALASCTSRPAAASSGCGGRGHVRGHK